MSGIDGFRSGLLALALVVPAGVSADVGPPWQDDLEPFVDGVVTTVMDQSAIAGAVVTIVSSDRVRLSKGYGIADAPTDGMADPARDVFPVASVTKVFTSLAILQLAERGRLALDDNVRRHLRGVDLDDRFGDITIAHLLGHTAGLEERYLGYLSADPEMLARPHAAQLSAILPRQVRPPGDVMAYSNAGYILLGEIVAQVSGQPFERYVAEQILAPLGMTCSGFYVRSAGDGASPPDLGFVQSHVWAAGRYVAAGREPLPSVHAASGGLATTADDMGRFLQALLREGRLNDAQILSPDVVGRLRTPVFHDRPAFAGRTFGYWRETWAGHTVLVHGGTHFGMHAIIVLVPSRDLAFFVAANSPSAAALMALPRRVLSELVGPLLEPAVAPVACADDCLRDYEGRYLTTRRNETRFDRLWAMEAPRLTVSAAGDGMLVLSGLGFSQRFHAVGDDRFRTENGAWRLGFRRDAQGRVDLAYLDGMAVAFDRAGFWLSSSSFTSGVLAALLGCAMCVLTWHVRRRAGMSHDWPAVSLGLVWGGLLVAGVLAERSLSASPHVMEDPDPGVTLWVFTGLAVLSAIATLIATGRLWLVWIGARLGLLARSAYSAAVASFLWAALVMWRWNLLSFDPLW